MARANEELVHYFRSKWTLGKTVWCKRSSAWQTRGAACIRMVLIAAAALLGACTQTSKSPIERAEFGVLFGGQVQERSEIPFELDATKQSLGFVITLRQPVSKPTTLHWELSKPGPLPASRVPDPINRRVELFDSAVAPGQIQIQKAVSLEPGDSLGLWNIRVTLGDQLAIDRAFMVVTPGPRRRKAREAVVGDAGT